MVVSGTQPLQNLKVLQKVEKEFGQKHRAPWAQHWIHSSFQGKFVRVYVNLLAIESILEKSAGKFCVGDEVTFADICLIPQVYNANRFSVDMSEFPTILKIVKNCEALEAFKKAHPDNQPGKSIFVLLL